MKRYSDIYFPKMPHITCLKNLRDLRTRVSHLSPSLTAAAAACCMVFYSVNTQPPLHPTPLPQPTISPPPSLRFTCYVSYVVICVFLVLGQEGPVPS